jgi:hypothetical protein
MVDLTIGLRNYKAIMHLSVLNLLGKNLHGFYLTRVCTYLFSKAVSCSDSMALMVANIA